MSKDEKRRFIEKGESVGLCFCGEVEEGRCAVNVVLTSSSAFNGGGECEVVAVPADAYG